MCHTMTIVSKIRNMDTLRIKTLIRGLQQIIPNNKNTVYRLPSIPCPSELRPKGITWEATHETSLHFIWFFDNQWIPSDVAQSNP